MYVTAEERNPSEGINGHKTAQRPAAGAGELTLRAAPEPGDVGVHWPGHPQTRHVRTEKESRWGMSLAVFQSWLEQKEQRSRFGKVAAKFVAVQKGTTESQREHTECNCMAKSQASEMKDSNGRPSAIAKSSADNRISLPGAGEEEPLGQVNHISWLCLKRLLKRSRDFFRFFLNLLAVCYKTMPYTHLFHIARQVTAIFMWWTDMQATRSQIHTSHAPISLLTSKQTVAMASSICLADRELEGDRKISLFRGELRVKFRPTEHCESCTLVYTII